MSSVMTGTVQRTFANPVGGNTLHSFTLKNEKGFFNLGRTMPVFKDGDSITFEAVPAKRAGNFEVEPKTIVINKDQPVTDYTMSGAKKTQVLQKDDYWNRREERDIETQKRIEIQACRNAAIQLLQAVGPEGVDDFDEFVSKYTDIFIKNNNERLA